MSTQQQQYTSIGGQAIIEGVMMRSPHFVAVAVRRPDKQIVIRVGRNESWLLKYPFLKKPILRGVVGLVESMIQGIDALGYSANIAGVEESKPDEKPLSALAIAISIGTAFLMGMGLFVALPHALTAMLSSERGLAISVESPLFHLIDGVLKMAILLIYVYAISMMKDIHRVFQYHGAEHKSIYTFEAGKPLMVEEADKFTTLHPRCGTSFLLFLVLISIAVFSFVFPAFGLTQLADHYLLNHVLMVFVKIVLMLPVAGIAYEFIKVCAYRMDHWLFKAMIWPGLMLQNLTTRKPDPDQLEVALASLRAVLKLEKLKTAGGDQKYVAGFTEEWIVANYTDVQEAAATVAEFGEE